MLFRSCIITISNSRGGGSTAAVIVGEVQANELLDALFDVRRDCMERFQSLERLAVKMEMVNIKRKSDFDAFTRLLVANPFQILPYSYFKDYAGLVCALEDKLEIVVDSDSDSDSEDNDLLGFEDTYS